MAKLKLVQQIPGDLQTALDSTTAWRRRNKQVVDDPLTDKRYPGRDFEAPRIPTIVTTQEAYSGLSDLQFGDEFGRRLDRYDYERPYIECWANPSATNWSTPRREAFQKVRAGSVRYSWRKRTRDGSKKKSETYYDEFPVQFTFQSGNIYTNPKGTFAGEVPPGLDDFYLFLKLCNQPKLMEDGRENWHIIVHTSPIFPNITLKGWFTPEGTSWAETAEGGFGMQWNATLEVHSATPSLWALQELQAKFAEYQREVP
jgi:hypothetical protein